MRVAQYQVYWEFHRFCSDKSVAYFLGQRQVNFQTMRNFVLSTSKSVGVWDWELLLVTMCSWSDVSVDQLSVNKFVTVEIWEPLVALLSSLGPLGPPAMTKTKATGKKKNEERKTSQNPPSTIQLNIWHWQSGKSCFSVRCVQRGVCKYFRPLIRGLVEEWPWYGRQQTVARALEHAGELFPLCRNGDICHSISPARNSLVVSVQFSSVFSVQFSG